MTRKDLCWSGGILLALSVAVWLWQDNRELRGLLAGRDNSPAQVENRSAGRADGQGISATASAPPHRDQPSNRSKRPSPRREPQPAYQPWQEVSTGGERPAPSPGREIVPNRSTAGAPREAPTKSPAELEPGTPAQLVAIPVEEAEKNRESLLRNGGFDKELAPWISKEGRVVSESGNPSNSVLEINPQEGAFSLSQKLQRSPASDELLLSFREMGTQDELCPIEISLVGADGKERLVYASLLDNSGKWAEHSLRFPSASRALAISIKLSSVKNPVWLDDVILREAKSISFAPGQ